MSNAELMDRRNAALPRGLASLTSVFVAKAENAELWDVEGKRYIDFAAGIAVCNTGHRHPKIMAATARQSDAFVHTAFQINPYEIYVSLAERLNRLAPIKDAKTIFLNSGTEAVENAVKIARHYTQRSSIIAFSGAFHGRSMLTMGLTGKAVPYKAGFGPMPAGIHHIPFPLEQYGVTIEDSLNALELLFKVDVPASQVAAIIIEPVQGEGGFQIAPKAFLQALRSLCDQHGILLICDEIQTGFSRTGKVFATEYADIEPDMLVVAKSLAGGYPLAGVIGKSEVMDSPEPGGLGTTYGGNPVSCAAAHAVLDIIEEEQLCERSNHIGVQMKGRLEAIKAAGNTTPIGEIRGLGAMVAFDLVKVAGGNTPNPDQAKRLTSQALENGLILLSCGIYGNTIRLLAPLTVPDNHLAEGLNILERSLAEC